MPRYIIEREAGKFTREELEADARKSKEVAAGMPGVVWIRSYVSEAEGKIYCEYHAPDPQTIRQHAEEAGVPVDEISEVSLEINPNMFV